MRCLIEDCPFKGEMRYSRGVCQSHYKLISRMVRKKKRTWEEFEKAGMTLPVSRYRGSLEAMMKKKNIK